uniref:Putative transcriptional regulator n=1 Tax=mine drainage metagenome TaxID=410659 RepID=E6PGP5_9ZZZZ
MSIQRCAPEPALYEGDLSAECALFHALADPARLRILATLARSSSEVCVCDLSAGFDLNQSTISHHLKILKDAALVIGERRGTWGFYRLAPGARERTESAIERTFSVAVPA